MLAPIILPDDITTRAKFWCIGCLSRWTDWRDPFRDAVGEETIVSPVDGASRSVIIYLSSQFSTRAFTAPPGVTDRQGTPVTKDGYFAILINRTASFPTGYLLAVLLHELTHVVDPDFLVDCQTKQRVPPEVATDPCFQYALPSEQRAFTSMWIEEVRDRVMQGRFSDLDTFFSDLCSISDEFHGFLQYASRTPQMMQQIRSHFRAIAEHLAGSQS